MKPRRIRVENGFTLIEAAITAVILMVGVIALIQIGRTTSNQVLDIRRTHGQPAIAERLIHDQIEALMAATGSVVPQVPPLGFDGVVYRARLARRTDCDFAIGSETLPCWEITAEISSGATFVPMMAGPVTAPPVRVWRR